MKRWMTGLMALMVVSMALSFSYAEKDHGEHEKHKAEHREKKDKPAKVYGEYRHLELTEAQRAQIAAIQKDIAERMKQLKEEEHRRIAEVLTVDQRKELEKMAAKKAKYRAAGYKGYIAKLENEQAKLREHIKQAKADGDAERVEKYEKKMAHLEEKLVEAKKKMEAAEEKAGE